MRQKDREVVLDSLKELASELSEEQQKAKIYHEGRNSYSWKDIIHEIEAETAFGKRYVENLVKRAKEEKSTLRKYLNQVAH